MSKYNSKESQVTIPLSLFQKLTDDSEFLKHLQAAGVDNWEWYGDAVEAHEAELQRVASAD